MRTRKTFPRLSYGVTDNTIEIWMIPKHEKTMGKIFPGRCPMAVYHVFSVSFVWRKPLSLKFTTCIIYTPALKKDVIPKTSSTPSSYSHDLSPPPPIHINSVLPQPATSVLRRHQRRQRKWLSSLPMKTQTTTRLTNATSEWLMSRQLRPGQDKPKRNRDEITTKQNRPEPNRTITHHTHLPPLSISISSMGMGLQVGGNARATASGCNALWDWFFPEMK